ncbi:MAG: hypothetical protein WBQ25_04000 [Nitrososphaeraceae archaeon]
MVIIGFGIGGSDKINKKMILMAALVIPLRGAASNNSIKIGISQTSKQTKS